jgi:hypothetical protein
VSSSTNASAEGAYFSSTQLEQPAAGTGVAATGGGGGGSSSSGGSSKSRYLDGSGSPVQQACSSLRRIQVGRSSWSVDGQQQAQEGGQQGQAAAAGAPRSYGSTGVQPGSYPTAAQQLAMQQHYAAQQQLAPATVAAALAAQRQHCFSDPEHLIVNGMGGAFMHPTHVFSYSRFAVLDDEAATATAAIYSAAAGCRCGWVVGRVGGWVVGRVGGWAGVPGAACVTHACRRSRRRHRVVTRLLAAICLVRAPSSTAGTLLLAPPGGRTACPGTAP